MFSTEHECPRIANPSWERTIVAAYATGGVDWWLPWGFAVGLQIRLGTAAGGAGIALNFATIF